MNKGQPVLRALVYFQVGRYYSYKPSQGETGMKTIMRIKSEHQNENENEEQRGIHEPIFD